mgnify:CR=1 FL=1
MRSRLAGNSSAASAATRWGSRAATIAGRTAASMSTCAAPSPSPCSAASSAMAAPSFGAGGRRTTPTGSTGSRPAPSGEATRTCGGCDRSRHGRHRHCRSHRKRTWKPSGNSCWGTVSSSTSSFYFRNSNRC